MPPITGIASALVSLITTVAELILSADTEVKITASDGAAQDRFGFSVAVGSGKIVVGANGDDDNGNFSGSAYIYDLDGTNETKITASDGAVADSFGYYVAVGSGKIVVGAPESFGDTGKAYIFDLDGTNEVKITASDGAADDGFGTVAIGSDRIVVGAATNDDDGSNSGSAYIFDLDGTQLAKITASDAAAGDRFGSWVAVGSGKIVVGAPFSNKGSAYIYDLDGTNEVKITASDGAAGDNFGTRVAVGDGKIVVGANGDDDNGSASGSAYIYNLDGTNEVKITPSDGAASDSFGTAIAIGNGRIVVGVSNDDDDGTSSGSVYIFDLDGNQLDKITASDAAASDRFGTSVAVGNRKLVVGAPFDDDNGSSSGSAYIYGE